MEVPPPHTSPSTLLAAWTAVQQAVRMASAGRLVPEARRLLQRAAEDMRLSEGELDHDLDRLAVETLVHLERLLEAVTSAHRSPAPGTTSGTTVGATPAGSDLELCTRPVRRGDVVCLLRVRGGGPAAYDALVARAGAVLRADDQLLPAGDDEVLVVLEAVSLSIAWRRMSGLVGGRPAADGDRTVVVHAGLAAVDDAGPAAALEAARGALLQAVAEAAGRIALARVA